VRILSILALTLCLAITAPAQSVQLQKVAGPDLDRLPTDGTYVRASLRGDTLWVWMEHIEADEHPNYEAAAEADAVLWCFPQKHPHPRHLLPDAEGRVAAVINEETLFLTEVGSPGWKTISN